MELTITVNVPELAPIQAEISQIRRLLARHVLPVPGPIEPRLVAEGDANMLIYTAEFPKKPDPIGDIVSQRLVITTDGAVLRDTTYSIADDVSGEFGVLQDATVGLSLTYIDDAANESTARTQEFVAKDTIAPSEPGDFGEVTLLREE